MKIRLFTIPNFITLLNLFAGCAAIVFALRFDDIQISFYFIALAAIFDFLDGMAARLLKSYSEVGKQLDSLADLVSFGVAPSAVLFSMCQSMGGVDYYPYFVFVLALFSALRLAKFNIDERQSEEFIGLPTPACALLVSSAGYLMAAGIYRIAPVYILSAAAVLSFLLISNIPMFSLKFKNFRFRDNALRYIFMILSLASLVMWKITAIPFIIIGYIMVSSLRAILCCSNRKDKK